MTQATLPEVVTNPPKAEPSAETGMALMIERLAANPQVDVAKLEKILEMQERVIAHEARAAFNVAFSEMQGEIPAVIERVKTNNGTYAPLEDIQDVVRPILQRHGFSLSFKTEWPDKATVKVIGILTHREGHERTSEFLSGADASGNKNAIQGLGSAVTYGRRYTTKDLLNITTRGADDDGAKTSKNAEAPTGYDDWAMDLAAAADEGWAPFQAAWKASKSLFRSHMTQYERTKGEALKARAVKADAGKANGGAKWS